MNHKKLLYILFFIFLCPLVAKAESIVPQIQRHYNNMSSMQADFKQTLLHRESGNLEERTGIFIFKKPLLVNWETKTPAPELIMVTEKEIWNAFPDEELVYKYSLDLIDETHSILRVVTGNSNLEQDFSIEEETKEANLTKLHLYPHEPVQELVEAFLWVEDFGMIKKIKVIDFFGNTNEISFDNAKFGTTLPESTFKYQVPKSFDLEDRTKGFDGSVNLMN